MSSIADDGNHLPTTLGRGTGMVAAAHRREVLHFVTIAHEPARDFKVGVESLLLQRTGQTYKNRLEAHPERRRSATVLDMRQQDRDQEIGR